MKKHELKVEKTARYFTLGELNQSTDTVWFVFHGYAQTADVFLESLKKLQKENTFIIAPEGLSRFYWKDFFSNPVASWMTKLDREADIKDTLLFLDKLYNSFNFDFSKIQINYLGFSQGVATMTRWIAEDKIKVNKVILYAGEVAKDIDILNSKNFKHANSSFIYGTNDVFIKDRNVAQLKAYFNTSYIQLKVHSFIGKHEINELGLASIL